MHRHKKLINQTIKIKHVLIKEQMAERNGRPTLKEKPICTKLNRERVGTWPHGDLDKCFSCLICNYEKLRNSPNDHDHGNTKQYPETKRNKCVTPWKFSKAFP